MDSEWNDSQPIYRQLRDRVVAMILDGVLKEGDPLPSVRNVAAEYRVNPLTVLKGYQELVDEQLIETRRGLGMFVNAGARNLLLKGERRKFLAATYSSGFDSVNAGEIFGQHLLGAADNDVLELTHDERSRIFNLGYFTWVEQQGVPLVEFERRRSQSFWRGLRQAAAAWDELIAEFNARGGFGKDC